MAQVTNAPTEGEGRRHPGDIFSQGKQASGDSRDAEQGSCLTYNATVGELTLTTGPTDFPVFVVDDVDGAERDEIPVRVAFPPAEGILVRIEDSATVAARADLALSSVTEGAMRTAVAGERVVARLADAAITVGAVAQYARVDLLQTPYISGETELPVVTGLTALAGGGQAGATALTGIFNNVTTVATAADSVLLPTAALGEVRTVKNSGANELEVFPNTSDSINALAANTSVKLEPGEELTFRAISATVWETDEKFFTMSGRIADVSTGGSTFSEPALYTGEIVEIYSTLGAAITVGDAALSFELEGVAITGGGITIATAGSAPGDVDSATPTAARTITKGNNIEQITDGGSTTAAASELTYKVRRTYQ